MLDTNFDRIHPQAKGDQYSNAPWVDMADRNEQHIFRSNYPAVSTNAGTSGDSTFLCFGDPYASQNIGSEGQQHSHNEHHRRHQAQASDQFRDQPTDQPTDQTTDQTNAQSDQTIQNLCSDTLSKLSIRQLEKLATQIIQLLEQELSKLGIGSNSSESGNSASSSGDSSACTNNGTESSSSAGSQEVSAKNRETAPSAGSTTAQQGLVDAVMAQSPNAKGPIAFDSAFNNASVVGFVGPAAGASGADVDRNASVDFKNMKSYVHLKTGGWKQIEDQNTSEIIGGYWKDDMKGESVNMTVQNAQGDATMTAPPTGYINHFWLHDGGGTIDPKSIDGFFSTAEAKASVPNSGLAASIGVDWFKPDGTEDGNVGGSTKLTNQWQTLYHTTLDRQTLENDPPPGISSSALDSTSGGSTGSPARSSSASTGLSETSTTSTDGSTNSPAKLIDLFPQTDAQWQQVTGEAPKGSLIVTESASDVNPKYDMPFDTIDPALKQHITDAAAAGMKPLGYVGTANGTKSLGTVEAEIDSWYKNADVSGIYVGNSGKADDSGYATDEASEKYFKEIANYIKSKGGMAVINGSGTPNPDYADYYDVQGTVEDSAANYAKYPEAAWQRNYSRDHFSAVLGGVPLSDLKQVESEMLAKNNGYITIADTYPNPMTEEYWRAEIANLRQP